MEGSVIQTPDFADRITAAQDSLLASSEDELSMGRRRFLAEAATPKAPSKRRAWPVLVALAAVVAFVMIPQQSPSLTALSDGAELRPGSWISSLDETRLIAFSDGTAVTLDEQSEIRLAELDGDGAHLWLERGHADLDVVHAEGADWLISAGPYVVRVTGTRFGASWSPVRQELLVEMAEGSVFVTGPHLEGGQRVSDSGTLSVFLAEGRYQHTMGPLSDEEEGAPSVVEVEKETPVMDTPLRVERIREPLPSPPVAVEVVTWKELAREGSYADALELAHEVGVDGILSGADSTDLYLFGDMARLAGKPELAGNAFVALRERFPGTRYASEASFVLGKMAYDNEKDFRSAARWLQTHISEQPDGTSVDDAMGLLMMSYDRVGDRAAARVVAKDYLERFPSGKSVRQAKTYAKRR
jgi:TolA-binding protein